MRTRNWEILKHSSGGVHKLRHTRSGRSRKRLAGYAVVVPIQPVTIIGGSARSDEESIC